jgi:signal transduction histidine kinase/DNA-binding response OmpR family regulator/HPt (histidine-containing phosphotransfer) domain-containing protein
MSTDVENPSPLSTEGASRAWSRLHPIVRLDFFVRLLACPIPAIIIISSRMSTGETIPFLMLAGLIAYGIGWPHISLYIARNSVEIRRTEMRLLLVDAAVAGAAIALSLFQTVPMLTLLAGYAGILGSVGGIRLLLQGMTALTAATLITGATITGFAVNTSSSPLNTALVAAGLFAFQTLMGLLTHRTARSLVQNRRRITEQSLEIQHQNEALLAAREEALQAAQAKAAFLATMSHEIRTPLNGVLGMTRLLADTSLTAEQQDFVRTIQVSGTTLLTVINDILDYSRIESGKMELEEEPFGVRAVVEEALEIIGTRARENAIELVCEVSPDVPELLRGDATRLRQLLVNLVGNAVKFTPQGEVVVTVSQLRPGSLESPAELLFRVRDTGIGIPEDRIAILFTPFSQADASTTRRYGGTGLGLAISRRLAELMGGAVSVESKVGEGSVFSFTIQARLAPDRRVTPRLAGEALAHRRVLVVDDNSTNRRVLCAQLQAWGMNPEAVASADEALQALHEREHYALAILDLHMPDVDGMTLAEQIRSEGRFTALPLILLSSSLVQSKDDPNRLFHSRLMKPVRQSKLFDSIVRVLDAASTGREMDRTLPGNVPLPLITPLRILVADDNEINRKLARLVLRRLGYDCDFAENGREALEAVTTAATSENPFDIVFMDVQMPEMDGLEATRRIRKLEAEQPSGPWPQIFAMTADAMPEDREVCLNAGMHDYLTKPLDFEAVRAALVRTANIVETRAVSKPGASEHAAQQFADLSRNRSAESEITETSLSASAEEPEEPREPLNTTRSSTAEEPEEPSTRFVDWSRLDEIREYDTPDGAVMKDILTSFMTEAPSALLRVRSSAAERDDNGLRSSAHALKGAAMNVGAVAIADCAAKLEAAAKAGAYDGIDLLIADLSDKFEPTMAELNSSDLFHNS